MTRIAMLWVLVVLAARVAMAAPEGPGPQVCDLALSEDPITRAWHRIHCWGTPRPELLCYQIAGEDGIAVDYRGPLQWTYLEDVGVGQVGYYYSPVACTWLPVFGTPEDINAQVRVYERGLGPIMIANGHASLPMPSRGEDITVEVDFESSVGKKTEQGCVEAEATSCMATKIKIKISLW